MQKPQSVVDLVGAYGARVDQAARAFLTRGPYDMYGMMRYFMGYEDEALRPTSEVFGGKRFRSGICLLLADQYGALYDALPVALSVEIFHNFTLLHDDIVDRDEMRRGRPTVWKLWGTDHAINTGDGQLLLAIEALEDAKHDIKSRARPFLLEKYREVVEGQYLDFTLTGYALNDPRTTEVLFLEMLTKKTSVLVAAATKAAGIAARVDDRELDALWRFGLALGLAYQLCDDAISIWGTSEMTGKVPHGDVREKKKTLPVLYTAHTLPQGTREEFCRLYGSGGSMSGAEVSRAIELMNSVGAYAVARTRVDEEAARAKDAVRSLTIPRAGKETLIALVDALLPRVTP
jgi:geranylgeranyl diphosphate synthase, type I